MARIGIDAHAIGERLTGNETYISNLIQSLLEIDSKHEFILFFTKEDAAALWQRSDNRIQAVLARPAQPLLRVPFVMPWLSWKERIDLLHVQYAGPPFLTQPLVTTIHDISFEHYPQFFTKRELLQFRSTIPYTARRADKILTVSDYSKRDLVETYHLPEDKIVVTYNGVATSFKPLSIPETGRQAAQKYGVTGPYLLAVGNLQPRKNLVRLIAAYTRLRNARPEIKHQLLVVGKEAWLYDPILDFARRSRWADDILFSGYVPSSDLPMLYCGAEAMVYPSIFEGFGLPPLEAMACGTPVIVSDRSALPEIVGDAGIKVNPFDIEAIAAAMAGLILEPDVARWYGLAGIKRAERFTWSNCATRTLEVYEEICAGKVRARC